MVLLMPPPRSSPNPRQARLCGRLRAVAELVIALNPDEDSRLPYLMRLPQPGVTCCFGLRGRGRGSRRCTATPSASTSGPPMR